VDHSIEEQTVEKKEPIEASVHEVPVSLPPNHNPRKLFIPVLASILVLLLIGAIAWVGYQKSTTPKQPQQQPKKLYPGKVGIFYDAWPGYIAISIAQKKGFFKQEGVDVDLKRYDTIAAGENEYLSKKIPGKLNVNLETVQENLKGFQQQVVLQLDYSYGADGIISSPGITDLSQIKGKKVAYEYGSMEDFFLVYALKQYNLTLKDIIGVDLAPQEAAQALVDKKVDVAVTYEPYLSSALQQTKGNKIYSTVNAPNLINDILTFNKEFIDTYPDTVTAIVRAYFEGLNYVQKHPQESYASLAKEYDTTPEDIQNQLKSLKLLNLQDNKIAFTFSPGIESLYGNLRTINQFLTENESSSKQALDTDSLVNGSFINKLVQ
jgi:NitT/TauT family transport system substrate-binding protein